MTFLFWFSLFFIIYTYAGYPCLLFIWSKLFPKKVNKSYLSPKPMVSVIIAALNEEKYIGARIGNLLEQEYPPEKMEIIIVSDGSKDATDDIVLEFSNNSAPRRSYELNTALSPRVKLIKYKEGKGKPHAINLGVQRAKREFLVFTDARQRFEQNAIKELIANFNDPNVGCVSGELIFDEDSDTSIKDEMGFYWSLEKRIRKMESAIRSVAGATGSIYAIRKRLFHPIPEETLLDDVFIPMNVVFQGYRTVFDGQAIAHDTISRDFAQEKRRKVRTLLGNYQLLRIMPGLLSPKKNSIFFAYVSHKIFRLFVPFFFLTILYSSFQVDGFIYKLAFITAIATLILSVADKIFSKITYFGKLSTLARIFVYFNYFALLAFFYFIWPGKRKVW